MVVIVRGNHPAGFNYRSKMKLSKALQEAREEIAFENALIAREVRAMHRDNYTHHFADIQREAAYADEDAREADAAWRAQRDAK